MATHNLYQLVLRQQRSQKDEVDLEDTNEQLSKVQLSNEICIKVFTISIPCKLFYVFWLFN